MTHQGRADRNTNAGHKVEPKSHAINPGGVDQLGEKVAVKSAFESLHQGRGYSAPRAGHTVHPSGSQGRHR